MSPAADENPTELAEAAIRRVDHRIEAEWPSGGRFFVSPPMLFFIMVLLTVLGFMVMFARARRMYGGGF